MSKKILRTVLFVTGLVVAALGVNVGFGGISTLGLQGQTNFFAVTDQGAFDVRDNHVRFSGGIILAIGLMMMWSAFFLKRAVVPITLIAVTFVFGGLARLSASDVSLLFSTDIFPSLIIELVGFPLLAIWVWREAKSDAVTGESYG
ncbi:MAG: DUF4345 domain-containing protein [Pseudomonadota bacterium]